MSKIEINNDTRIVRHRTPARISHWMLVICFFMTMFTGVAFFFPDFAWLTEILGTPQIARAIHPFTGIFNVLCLHLLGIIVLGSQYSREKTIFAGQKVSLKFLKGTNTRLLIMANITLVKKCSSGH